MPVSSAGLALLCSPRSVKVGRTSAQVVYHEGKVRLLHYLPQAAEVSPIPVVLVYALVNRPYILDLLPGRSVVEHFLKGGLDLYLIDWGVPDHAERWRTLADYITGYLHHCVERTKELTGAEAVSLFGYCQGGTFAAIYTALYPESVKNVILLAAPIDFGVEEGLLHFWSKKEYFDVDKVVDTFGNIPPWVLNNTFVMLRPVYYLFDKYASFGWSVMQNQADDAAVEEFLAIEKWLADGIPHPGETFREFVKACYQENRLIRNELKIGSCLVDLRRITCAVCNIVPEQDHVIPPQSSLAFNHIISSQDKECILFPSTHLGASVGGRAAVELWPRVVQWLQARSGASWRER